MQLNRRSLLQFSAASAALGLAGLPARAQTIDELVIAYNVNLPSWDPTVGPSAVNPTIQGLYQSVFDQFILQQPDLKPAPGLLTDWGWNDDKTKVSMTVRDGVTWHDGSPFTAEDVAWSLTRAADEKTGNPIQFIWSTLANIKAEGNVVTADVARFEPTIFKWMYFLTGYVLPKAYYEKVGAEGFEAAPIGTGPYMVDKFERNAFVRLKANANYWGGKPDFDTVTIKFVTDAAARVAEIESGASHVTLEMPYEEYDRLKGTMNGVAAPISDIGMIFLNDIEAMTDPNVRKAAAHAIDKQTIIDRLLSGYGVKIDTLETPQYDAYDASITVP
ncbi:MAG: peptide ABC transporter substrate-binding protein, partial [Rhodoferax sp.]|nr:peptide ABC transporter substrate-binding protein [Pseudorhodobacter sp.]